jgi:TetR/AcrR family transcriptional regulator, regulator of mycofactocin system
MAPGATVKPSWPPVKRHDVKVHEGQGRPPVTSRAELERFALELFGERGFSATTVEDIAAAAGVSRRTFFRYYASKNDVVWGDFDALLGRMDDWLASSPDDAPLLPTLTDAVVRFNSIDPDTVTAHRQRMSLILHVPALQAHSTLRYADWRGVVAKFAARQLRRPEPSLLPQLVGHVALAAAVAAYEQWLADDDADLEVVMAAAFAALQFRFAVDTGADH